MAPVRGQTDADVGDVEVVEVCDGEEVDFMFLAEDMEHAGDITTLNVRVHTQEGPILPLK